MILNENINEFDNVEKHEVQKHSIKDYFKNRKKIIDLIQKKLKLLLLRAKQAI